jgi:hypothetical protein
MRSAYQRLQGAGLLSLLLLATVASAVAQAPLQQSQKTLNAPQAQNEPPAQQSQRVHHKHLVPVNLRDILTFIAIFAGIFVASGAGVGGGERWQRRGRRDRAACSCVSTCILGSALHLPKATLTTPQELSPYRHCCSLGSSTR